MIAPFISELVRTVIIMTITGSLLCLLLLALKPLIRHRLPKWAQYCFWLVALAALLIPISQILVLPYTAPTVVPVHSMVERHVISVEEETVRMLELADLPWQLYAAANNITSEEAVRTVRSDFTQPPELPPAGAAVLSTVFMFIYPLAVSLIVLYSLIGYAIFTKKLRRGYSPTKESEQEMLLKLSEGRRTPKLMRSSFAPTPMLTGLIKPTIVLPEREYTSEQLRGILLHELAHMRRFDIAVKWFSLLACAIHWFNPIVWIAKRQIDRACELACDEAVISDMDINDKQYYGETLIAVAGEKKVPLLVLSTTMCSEKIAIKERLTAIMKSKTYTRSAIIISAALLMTVLLTACAVGAGGGSAGETNVSDTADVSNDSAYVESDGTAYESDTVDYADLTREDIPAKIASLANQYILHLAQNKNVAIFDSDNPDTPVEIRPANFIDTRIYTLELEAKFDDILPYSSLQLWRLNFMLRTDDLETETLRWGTFSPDETGWVGHHSGWNDAHILLVVGSSGDIAWTLGDIPWWMEENPLGLEGALQTFLAGSDEQELCYCGEHYVGEDLRIQIPPLFARNRSEFDFQVVHITHYLTAFEHGDMLNPVWQVSRGAEINDHTLILWTDEPLRDVRFLALGLDGEGEEMSFYTRELLHSITTLNPGESIALNVSFLHYLIPRFGITFLDESGEITRVFVRESMRGGCFPLLTLGLHDETHFALWTD